MTEGPLAAERAHLAGMLEAIQRCVFFLDASRNKQRWPLSGETLSAGERLAGDVFELGVDASALGGQDFFSASSAAASQ